MMIINAELSLPFTCTASSINGSDSEFLVVIPQEDLVKLLSADRIHKLNLFADAIFAQLCYAVTPIPSDSRKNINLNVGRN